MMRVACSVHIETNRGTAAKNADAPSFVQRLTFSPLGNLIMADICEKMLTSAHQEEHFKLAHQCVTRRQFVREKNRRKVSLVAISKAVAGAQNAKGSANTETSDEAASKQKQQKAESRHHNNGNKTAIHY